MAVLRKKGVSAQQGCKFHITRLTLKYTYCIKQNFLTLQLKAAKVLCLHFVGLKTLLINNLRV